MRVLHVVASDRRRGGEILARGVIGALAREGLDQRVAVLHPSPEPQVAFDAPVNPLHSSGWRVPGIRTDLGILNALRTLAAAWAPDVIQAWGGEPFRYSLVAAGGRPVVYTRIGWASSIATKGPRRMAHARLLRRAARVIAVADAVRAETVGLFGLPEDRVVMIPSVRDPKALEPARGREAVRRDLGIPTEAPVLLSLGALSPEKDPLAHLEVGRRVRDRLGDAIHVVAGDGSLRSAVEQAARAAGDSIRVLGPVSEVGDLLAASDALLLASRSEGMPMVLVEAGMAGLPVAAYSVAGVPEVIEDGRTGLLAPAGNVEALAAAAIQLLSDPELRRSLGRAARERCLERYDVGPAAVRYQAVYEEVAAGRR